jgi:hypothetical protein
MALNAVAAARVATRPTKCLRTRPKISDGWAQATEHVNLALAIHPVNHRPASPHIVKEPLVDLPLVQTSGYFASAASRDYEDGWVRNMGLRSGGHYSVQAVVDRFGSPRSCAVIDTS